MLLPRTQIIHITLEVAFFEQLFSLEKGKASCKKEKMIICSPRFWILRVKDLIVSLSPF